MRGGCVHDRQRLQSFPWEQGPEEVTESSIVSQKPATRTVVVSHPTGLCLRGASAIRQLAGRFHSAIQVVKEGRRVSVGDVLQVVSLGAEPGSQVVLEATGPDADEALDALVKLFADNFGLAD
jgi:phosphocarrier protein HPr